MRIVRRLTIIIMCLCSAVAITALLAWLGGRLISDVYHWSQYLSWIPTPVAIIAAILGLFGCIRPGQMRRRRRIRSLTWLLIFLSVSAWYAFGEHRALHRPPQSDAPALRIAHWTPTIIGSKSLQRHAEVVTSLDADITLMTDGRGITGQPLIRNWLESHGGRSHWAGICCILTKLRLLGARPIVAHRIDEESAITVSAFVVDAQPVFTEPLNIWVVNLPSDVRLSRRAIAHKLQSLLADQEVTPPDIVVGDFNMPRSSVWPQHLFPAMTMAWDEAGTGYGATFHRDLPLVHIDHVLLSPDIAATRYDLHDPGFGRHLIQIVEVVPR